MGKTIKQVADETGRSIDEVRRVAYEVGASAWGARSMLDDRETNMIMNRLGAQRPGPTMPPPSAPLPPPGPTMPPPGASMPPPGSTMPPPGGYPPPPGASMPPPGGYLPPPSPPPPGGMLPPPSPGWSPGAPQGWPPSAPPPLYGMPGVAPPKPKRSAAKTALIVVGVGFAGLIGLSVIGAVAGSGSDDPGDESVLDRLPDILGGPQPIDLEVGDCFDDNSDVPIVTGTSLVEASIEQVPCAQAHDAEVYHLFDHPAPPDSAYPGDGAMFDTAIDACLAQFDSFVGAPYETSALEVYFLAPTSPGFSRLDERQISCAVVALDGSQLTGTMRGSGR